MDNDWLAILATSFGNIATAIGLRLPKEDGAKPPFDDFEDALHVEVKRLRDMGQDRLALALATGWQPLERLVKEGW